MMGNRSLILSGMLLWAGNGIAVAEPLPIELEPIRNSMRDNAGDLARLYQELSIISITPGISAANFRADHNASDPLDIDSWKLAPSYAFDIGVDGFRPYIEGTFGYVRSDQNLDLGDSDYLRLDTKTLSALGGVGAEFDIASNTILRPMVLVGYSHTSNDASSAGFLGDTLYSAGRGVIADFKMRSMLYGGALELEQRHRWENDVKLTANLRYDYLVDDIYSASDSSLEERNEFNVLTGATELNGPTDLAPFGLPLRWIGFITGTYMPDTRGDIGFDYFVEIGGGIELVDNGVIPGIEGVSLRGSGIVGDGVEGWSVGLSAEF
ncbi:hypothetical protein HQN64_14525 [Enterobacteriaceae bacterium BIT-l23]|uniref:Autotransporter domain-containing protein n=1 Tax=Jejubacter calystegiae TaxID=2579935 RepID=A0A4P8YMC9_9ENTR|nr:hypothetical protein [Jejubacter calystegiae]NUU67310.1 hypothetical protein [Enterobacteriaceae bacterium BIT-l23]QCT21995.1 hypothetical protein FEM41_21265 [Jejubacter calystegiae]